MSDLALDPLLAAVASRPDALAVSAASYRWTNHELEVVSSRIVGALAARGVSPGHRVACVLADDAPAVALIHAVRRLGAVLVPFNRRASTAELRQQLELADPRVLVHDRSNATLTTAAADDETSSTIVVAVESMIESDAAANVQLRTHIDPDAVATIVFTSGTTSRAKGAMLTHRNHQSSAAAWGTHLGPRPSDRWLACLPLFHVAGLAIVLRSSYWQVPLEVHERFDAAAVWAALQAGISHVSLVTIQLERLLDECAGQPLPRSLRAILLGGGPIPASLLERARQADLPIVTTYGMTETASGVAAGTIDSDGAALSLPGVELRVGAIDAGGIDEAGEIEVHGPMVFAGYLGDPEATGAALVDGWLRSGDIGSIDEHGLLRVMDRRADLLISGGENVYPAEIEAVLLSHPDVADAAVVGQPDATWGSVPIAAIVVRPAATATDATLETHCRERLAHYKVPVRFVRCAALPRNAAGKIQRGKLRQSLLEEPE